MMSGSTNAVHSCQVGNGLASALFVVGTQHMKWLNNWRDTWAFEVNNELASIPSLMSSLRAIAENRIQQLTVILMASFPNERGLDSEAYCTKCRHRHKNKYCYILHPELAPSDKNESMNNAKEKSKRAALSINTMILVTPIVMV